MRTKTFLILTVAVAALGLIGCAAAPKSGVVDWFSVSDSEFLTPGITVATVGSSAPDIPFISRQGRQTSLHKIRRPVTILAFTTPDPLSCCSVRPELISLVTRLQAYPVTVVQLSQPTPQCPEGPGCLEVCSEQKIYLLALCDAERTAWIRYGEPEPDSVMLIDNKGKIVDMRSMSDLDAVAEKAERLSVRSRMKYRRSKPGYRI